jgi:hypothetical protein
MWRNVIFLLLVASVSLGTEVAVGGTKAKNPDPADGAVGVTAPLLQWTKGDGAVFHDVYLGTTAELTAADRVAASQSYEMYYHQPGFQPGVMYYWRVDEIEGDGTILTGNVWHFMTQDTTAYYPSPADGARNVVPAPTLTWMPGSGATKHQVYFSDSLDAVSQGAADADKGVLELETTTFAPGELTDVTVFYWRIDEILSDQTVRSGPVWSFTTFLSVDDFESYNDEEGQGTRIYETWIDGYADQSSGSTVGNIDAPFAEQTIVHGGLQAMPLDYNNVVAPYYSEAVRTWATPQDWTAGDVNTLTLYFRGVSTNSVERLYVTVEDSKGNAGTAVYPDAGHIALPVWVQWQIPLSELTAAGVDLTRVKKLYIGVGDPDNPVAGGTGRIRIDDIFVGGPSSAQVLPLFAEDFEGLPLGPNVDESLAGAKVWTKQAPPGWVHDDNDVPGVGTAADGVTEWAGWSFTNRLWWVQAAEDQDRSQFTKGVGTIAVADDDEWDDQDHGGWDAGYYTTYLSTPAIDLSAAQTSTFTLKFDSAWKPECFDDGPGTNNQTAQVTVSYDGAKAVEVLRWQSDSGSPYYHGNATNETVVLSLDAPAGAKTMVLTFGLLNAGNDWWWSIDNVEVTPVGTP